VGPKRLRMGQTLPKIHHVAAGGGPCIEQGGQTMHVKLTGTQSDGELTIVEAVILPDNGPPLHVHAREHESYFVLEGTFEFVCGDDVVRGGPGTFVHAPRGIPHRYANIGAAPGRLLFSFTPSGIESFFFELGKPQEMTVERMLALAAAHGITILLPA
jgi:mannose-6-phosphate isomerase-like protein (cupin superfamily)